MFVRTLVAVAAGFIASTAAIAADTARQPTGKWVVKFDDAQCLAYRDYGTVKDPLTLVLKQPPLGSVVQVAVVAGRGRKEPAQFKAGIGFDGMAPTHLTGLQFRPKDGERVTNLINVPEQIFARARSAKAMHVRVGRFEKTFALSDMTDLLKVMGNCLADLRRLWNVDATDESDRPLQSPRAINLRGLFRADDYPFDAVFEGQGGTTKVALLVDEAGNVADCSIVETSGVAILDSQTCAVIRTRAKFRPILAVDGTPTKASFIQRITWRIHDDDAPLPSRIRS